MSTTQRCVLKGGIMAALQNALLQLRSAKTSTPSIGTWKPKSSVGNSQPSLTHSQAPAAQNTRPFSVNEDDLFDFDSDDFLYDGDLSTLPLSSEKVTFKSAETNLMSHSSISTSCDRFSSNSKAQSHNRHLSSLPVVGESKLGPLSDTLPTSLPCNSTLTSHTDRNTMVTPPSSSSVEKLKRFRFVKSHNVSSRTASRQQRRPLDDCTDQSDILTGAPPFKRRGPCDDVTNVEDPCDDVTNVGIPCDDVTNVGAPCDGVTNIGPPVNDVSDVGNLDKDGSVQDLDNITFRDLFSDTDIEGSAGCVTNCLSSQQTHAPGAGRTLAPREMCVTQKASFQARHNSSQSNPRTNQPQLLVETSVHACGATSTPTISCSQDAFFKTPEPISHTSISSYVSKLHVTNLSTPKSSLFPTSDSPNSNTFSFPNRSPSLSVCKPTSNTPVGFRTPILRQPSAVVRTPLGGLYTPNIVRTRVVTKRKFPGPAGLLPSLALGQSMDNIHIQPPSTPRPASTPRRQAQLQRLYVSNETTSSRDLEELEECFSDGPWIEMLKDLDMSDSQSSALLQCNIANTIKQASSKQLRKGKVAHLRVLLKSISPAGKNASAILKDPTGEMLCTIHSKVLEEYGKELQPGTVFILRQVSVFSPGLRKYYLNVTPDNIIRIYPPVSSAVSPSRGVLDLSEIEKLHNTDGSPLPPSSTNLPCSTPTSLTKSTTQSIQNSLCASVSQRQGDVHLSQLRQTPTSLNIFPPSLRQSAPVLLDVSRTQSHEEPGSGEKSASTLGGLFTGSEHFLKEFQDFDDDSESFEMDHQPHSSSHSKGKSTVVSTAKPLSITRKESSFFNQLCEDEFDKIFDDMDSDNLGL